MWVAITFGDVREQVDVYGPFRTEEDAAAWLAENIESKSIGSPEAAGVFVVTPPGGD
jgi:hypothetical protein